jgi:L-arabinokinase
MQTMLRLPFAHQMDCFANVTDVPLVTAVGAPATEETRHALRIEANDSRPVVFLAMRAHVSPEVVQRAASGSPEFVFVALSKREAGFPENLRSVRLGPKVSFADVVAAADIVVSKPGYGIVAACAAHETNFLYPRRYGFREDEVLLAEAPRYTRIREIPRAAYETGMWAEHLQALRQQPEATERPGLHGADVCARIIADRLE